MTFCIDVDLICRDDACEIPGIHGRHDLSSGFWNRRRRRLDKTCNRRVKRAVWLLDDPEALTQAVLRATSRFFPTHMQEILQAVHNDYGYCHERTVYRHLRKLVQAGKLVKLDVGLSFCGYIQPGARLLKEPETLREAMADWVGQGYEAFA